MCRVDYDDGYARIDDSYMRTARREHRCEECCRVIKPGEQYEYASQLTDDGWFHGKTCAHCVQARRWLVKECGGFIYGQVLEELVEHWEEGYRVNRLGRLIVAMRSKWRGGVMPVPQMVAP